MPGPYLPATTSHRASGTNWRLPFLGHWAFCTSGSGGEAMGSEDTWEPIFKLC